MSEIKTHEVMTQKIGMMRVFDNEGNHVPVTVLKILPTTVVQVKTVEKDGYSAVKCAYNLKHSRLLTKPALGELKALGEDKMLPSNFFEIRANSNDTFASVVVGDTVSLAAFEKGDFIDVTAISKGKGFSGVVKKFGFRGGPATHGSHFHRRPGSIGNRATPARVFKNKKMPGQHGQATVTTQNLVLFEKNLEQGYVLVKGSVPGGKSTFVTIKKAIKK